MARQKARQTRRVKWNLLKKALLTALSDYLDVIIYRGGSALVTGTVTAIGVKGFVSALAPQIHNPQLTELLIGNAVTIAIILDFSINSLMFFVKHIRKEYLKLVNKK